MRTCIILDEYRGAALCLGDWDRLAAGSVSSVRDDLLNEDAVTARTRDAGLDVFKTELLPADPPFRCLPNLLATPHLGYVSRRNQRTFFTKEMKDIGARLTGCRCGRCDEHADGHLADAEQPMRGREPSEVP